MHLSQFKLLLKKMAQLFPSKNIVIFGGAFDPIHLGHIDIIKTLLSFLQPVKFFVVPVFKHHFKSLEASYEDRLKMIDIALKDNFIDERVQISLADKTIFDNKKNSLILTDNQSVDYNSSLETILYFSKLYPTFDIYYPLGSDNISSLNSFYRIDTLSKIAKIVEISRGSEVAYDNRLSALIINRKIADVSSSDVRLGKSVLTSVNVLNYIIDNGLYFTKKMRSLLSDARFQHSVSVARTAYQIAIKNRLDPYICFQAGLFHDIGKDLDSSTKISMMKKFYPKYFSFPKFSYHQFLSSYISKHVFGISSSKVLKAILYHCTGNKNLTEIEKCIYVADKAEPLREYKTSHLLEAAFRNLDEGFVKVIEDQKDYLIKQHKDYLSNPWTREMYKQYLNIQEEQ